ncbi:MAG: hypothetical protein IT449_04015 [Phycisphaerales bacterium]|nr:hypothetical protein [Phycisphaerales bacterium]
MTIIIECVMFWTLLSAASTDTRILYDSLCITDEGGYAGYGCHCGGDGIWGAAYDLQYADDFELQDMDFITNVTADFVSHRGLCASRACLSFHAPDDDCLANNDAIIQLDIGQGGINCEPFEDSEYGLEGVRVRISLVDPVALPAGRWYVSMQPADSEDWSYIVATLNEPNCGAHLCGGNFRDGGGWNTCCEGMGGYGYDVWTRSILFEEPTAAMRIEGIPGGDCGGSEDVSAKCKPGDGGRPGKIIVKVRKGQPNGTVTALLDPPDPRSMSIALDDRGRGKGKFRDVPLGEHRVFVCDSIVEVTCAP